MSESLPIVARTALRLAAHHSALLLPCPECAAEVKGENLAKHLVGVHGVDSPAGGVAVVRGSDQRLVLVSFVFTVFVMLGVVAAPVLTPAEYADIAMVFAVAALFAAATLAGIGMAGLFPAAVRVEPNSMELRFGFGAFRRSVRFPAKIETGGLMERRLSTVANDGHGYYGPTTDHHAGSYIRFVGRDGRAITVGAKRSTHPAKFWLIEPSSGARRRYVDIQMTPEELVKLQYLLSDVGAVEFRGR